MDFFPFDLFKRIPEQALVIFEMYSTCCLRELLFLNNSSMSCSVTNDILDCSILKKASVGSLYKLLPEIIPVYFWIKSLQTVMYH